ncbi:MAG: transposase [Sulfitobacter sp.]
MSDYIRRRSAGASYFFTIRLTDRSGALLVQEIDQLRVAMRATLARLPFRIDAIAVLPSVIHTIWTLPAGDDRYPTRIAMMKSRFSRAMPMPAHRTLTQIKRAEKGIWQRRYWEHELRGEADFVRHRDMIYLSPVQAGLCPRPQDWPHSSFHRDMQSGATPPVPLGYGDGAARLHLTRQPQGDARNNKIQSGLMQR